MSVAFVLSASLSTIAYAEEVSATANVSITAKIDALKMQREMAEKNAQLEKQKMEMLRASTTAKMEAGKIMLQAKLASSTARFEEKKEEIKDRIASTSAFMKERRAEIKSDIEIRIGKKLDEQRTKIAQRFEDAIKNLNSLVTRIDSRLAKMQASGIDITTQSALLDTAKLNITAANTELTTLETMLSQPIATSTRKTTIAAIEAQTKKAKGAAETARKSLLKVIVTLTPERDVRASSTMKMKEGEHDAEIHASSTIER